MGAPWIEAKYLSPDEVESKVEELRKSGKSITTLNGSFDLLHAGHLKMIYEASCQGDVLIVGLNSDASIKKYKSPLRPIVPLEERLEMMAALEFVDFVTYFDETTPIAFLEKVRPNVHVNGAEYGADCIEGEMVKRHGGKLHIAELVPGKSTSNLIEKIKSCV
ncbi:MAG: adenylyltransferase/cytidyltransferase family protein [Chlamydiia bacterium]|nr:adenylyltransferase/cytidyltransferase family protein [Chlamydiia bacterium]